MSSLQLKTVGEVFDCCGLGGISFHQVPRDMGANPAGKILAAQPTGWSPIA
jgi:hypothetical protein